MRPVNTTSSLPSYRYSFVQIQTRLRINSLHDVFTSGGLLSYAWLAGCHDLIMVEVYNIRYCRPCGLMDKAPPS